MILQVGKDPLGILDGHGLIFTYVFINIHIALEHGWLEYDRFLLGPEEFSGAKWPFVFGSVLTGMILQVYILLMVQKSQGQPPGMVLKPCKQWDMPQLVIKPDFWLPSTVSILMGI